MSLRIDVCVRLWTLNSKDVTGKSIGNPVCWRSAIYPENNFPLFVKEYVSQFRSLMFYEQPI
jgi:hypothetical protein